MSLKRSAFFIATAVLAALSAQAQEQETGDTTKTEKVEKITVPIKTGRIEIHVYENIDTATKKPESNNWTPSKPEARDFWDGLDLGFGGFVEGSNMSLPSGNHAYTSTLGKSGHVGFNAWEIGLPIYKHHMTLVTGLGMDFNHYRFSKNYNPLLPFDTAGNPVPREYITNRFITTSLTLPIMIGLDFGKTPGEGLNMSFGVVGSFVFETKVKEKYADNNSEIKRVTNSDFAVNPFRLNARAKIGYGSVGIFANYSLTPLFKNGGTQPELYPFSFGVSFG